MFLKIGHRGAKAYATENTIAGFRKAMELGANAIEFDVRRTRDGKLAVIHDDSLERVFGKNVRVASATLDELKARTDGLIPSLEEALRFIGNNVDRIVIELKETGCGAGALHAVRQEGLLDRVVIGSFLEEALEEVRRLDKDVETGLIYARHFRPIDAALSLKAQYLMALYRVVHTRTVDQAHRKGLKIAVWTINDKEEAVNYRKKGVDGIASDKPDILNGID